MEPDQIDIRERLSELDLEPFPRSEVEGAVMVDAFIIFRYQKPEWKYPQTAYASSAGMEDVIQIGLMTLVLDYIRDHAITHWED